MIWRQPNRWDFWGIERPDRWTLIGSALIIVAGIAALRLGGRAQDAG